MSGYSANVPETYLVKSETFTLASFANWDSVKDRNGSAGQELYLVFGINSNSPDLGIDNIRLIEEVPSQGPYPLYPNQKVPANLPITVRFKDDGEGAFSQGTFTVDKSENESQEIVMAGGWTTVKWYVDSLQEGSGQNFVINAGDYTTGKHTLSVIAMKNGKTWSKALSFTVTN
jgi:hypothetical protein